MKLFEEMLIKVVFFITETQSKDPFTCDGIPIKLNQKYMRELKVIDLLIDILIYPFEGEGAMYDLQKINQKSPITKLC